MIALVFGPINFSNSAIGGNAKPFSIYDSIGLTIMPPWQAKPL